MTASFPLLLDLTNKRVVVVGGGIIGTRRALQYADAGAAVTVIAPDVSDPLLANSAIDVVEREFEPTDIDGAWLVCAATSDATVNKEISVICEARQTFCVNSADADHGTAATPAVAHGHDGVLLAVSGAGNPRKAQEVRNALEMMLPKPKRPHVVLVGAGPGDPGLITVRGLQALLAADVLVVDRLAPRALWSHMEDLVEVIQVGKSPGQPSTSQQDINDILISRANAGNLVVRLKGGDPFVLGRGGEEALACIKAGVSVEVIPGVTSAISVPAAAGIPITHRGVTASFVVASGHEGPEAIVSAAKDAPSNATLVLLMGTIRLADVATALIAHGRAADTPAAVIESGWTAQQRTTTTTLGELGELAPSFRAPAIVVVGDVAAMHDRIGDLSEISAQAGHSSDLYSALS